MANLIRSNPFRRGLPLLILLSLGGCASLTEKWHGETSATIDKALSEKPQPLEVPAEIETALLPPATLPKDVATDEEQEKRCDINAIDTPARTFLMSLAHDTPYSIIVHPSVTGRISLSLKNVTVLDTLKVLREMYGYEFQRDGNRFYVTQPELQTHIYPVSYLNLDRKGESTTHVSSGELSQSSNGSSTGSTRNTVTNNYGIQVETRTESDFWKELQSGIKTIVGDDEGRRVIVNPQAGVVVVRGMPSELRTVEQFLAMIHTTINRQVVIEAKIVEVQLEKRFQSGINWAALGNVDGSELFASQTGGGTVFNGTGVSETAGNTGNLRPDGQFSGVNSAVTSAFGGVFSLAVKTPDFAAFLELLHSQGDVQVLSSPRVSTINNQRAVIKVGGDEFFVTGVTNPTTTLDNSNVVQPASIELTPFFSGIALDVTPQIDPKHNIVLHIHPTVSTVAQRNQNFVVSGDDFTLPLAFSTIQESDNVVRAKSGQIIVIGGLMNEASTDDNASVPLLGDIPVIGNVFKHKHATQIKKELVILLKPTVVDNDDYWQKSIAEIHDKM